MSLFSSILPCLLAAFGLGALLGWALKSLFGDRKLIDLDESWAARLRGKEGEWETGNAKLRSQFNTLQTDFNASTATVRAHEASLVDWETKYGALEASVATKTAELDKANASWNSKYSLLEADLAAKAADLEKANTDWPSKYGLLEVALAAKTAAFDNVDSDWKAKFQTYETRLAERNFAFERAEADWKAKSKAMETELVALRTRVVDLEALGGQAKDWEAKYLTAVQDKDAEIGRLQGRVGELEPLNLQAKDWEMKFLKVSDDKESEIKELQRQLSELEPLRGQAKDWELKYTAILQERESETSQLRGRISELEPLSLQINDWQAKYQATVAEKDETINALKTQLSAAGAVAAVSNIAATAAPRGDLLAIEGIGDHYLEKLNAVDLYWQAELLDQGATKKGRQEIAEKSGIAEKLILRWVNHIDLIRIKGIGPEYAELLEAAGVDSVPELAQRNAENLQAKLLEVNDARNLVGRVPSVNEVTDWIQQAKDLPRVVTH